MCYNIKSIDHYDGVVMKEITQLDEMKSIELSIMKKVHTICENNDIEYFICYGTLLGAVRHGGFIPWDDDIDIFMKRPVYERFLKLYDEKREEFDSAGLEIVNRRTKKYYGRIITKVIDTRTYLVEPEYRTDDPFGVFIDIWPLDGTPNNPSFRKIYVTYAKFVKKLLLASSMKVLSDYSFGKKTLIRIASLFDPSKVLAKLEGLAQRYNTEDSEYYGSYQDLTNVYSAECYRSRILYQYEDASFWGPEDYDTLLKADYGDYMTPPPEEDRIPNHTVRAYYKD